MSRHLTTAKKGKCGEGQSHDPSSPSLTVPDSLIWVYTKMKEEAIFYVYKTLDRRSKKWAQSAEFWR
jgi:hypothetical protein